MDAKTSPEAPEPTRGRVCLYKGCGKRFVPRPQDRTRAKYCPDCRAKAKKWRDWRRRQTAEGRAAKRVENKRVRKNHPDYSRTYRARNLEAVRSIERDSKRRSRSRKPDVHKVRPLVLVPCGRPGCFEVFSVVAAFATVRRYCGEACRGAVRRCANLLAQLRHRATRWGNYQRKRSRLKSGLLRRDARFVSLPPVGSSPLEHRAVPVREEPRNRGPPRIVAWGPGKGGRRCAERELTAAPHGDGGEAGFTRV